MTITTGKKKLCFIIVIERKKYVIIDAGSVMGRRRAVIMRKAY